jgi:hypothetical protein
MVSDCVSFCAGLFRSRTALAAENLFLRKQLALSMANSQIMRRLECGTALDSVAASGTSRGLMVMQRFGQVSLQPGMSAVAVVVVLKID